MFSYKKKSGKPAADMPLKLLTANASEIANEAKAATDFSYSNAFEDSKVLVIGDTGHNDAKIVGSLVGSIGDMAASGVERFLIELPKDPEIISAIDELNTTGNAKELSKHLDGHSQNPLQLIRLLKEVHAKGIEIVPIDMPFSMQKDFDDKSLSEERGIYMGNEIAKHSNDTEGKTVVFCGLYHLNNDQIPAVLKSRSINYKSAALFTEHQSATPLFGASLTELSICQYIESQNRTGKDTLVKFRGTYGIDFAFYLKWEPQQNEDHKTGGTVGYTELKLSMEKDVYADFSDSVEPDSKLWKNTNLKKIVKTMELFGDTLNEFQKFYLSMSLGMYLDSTMHNGGGSIVDIKYEGKDKAFKIRTVDTFHYKYSKDVDYGALMRYREVTVGMLLSQYGIPRSALGDESTFKDAISRIKIEPKGKDVAYKLIFMALASRSGIGTVGNDSEGMYLTNTYGKKLVSVKLDEIKIDERTFKALEAGREILEWSLAAQDALNKAIGPESKMGRRTKRALLNALGMDEMMKPMYFFLDGISLRVSESYSRFEPMGDSEFSSMTNDFIKEASALEESIKRAHDLLPEGAYGAFDINSMLMSEKRYISKSPNNMNVRAILDSCINVLKAKRSQMAELSEHGDAYSDFDLLRK